MQEICLLGNNFTNSRHSYVLNKVVLSFVENFRQNHEHYYQQIRRYYKYEMTSSDIEEHHPPQENLDDPPF